MKAISQEFKDMISFGGKQNDLIATVDNVDYKPQRFKYSFKGDLFKTAMSEFEIDIKNIGNTIEKEFNVKFGLLIDNEYEYIEWNKLYVNQCEIDEDKELSKSKAYDEMIKFMVMYNIESPASNLLDYLKDICNEVGVELYSEDFYNSDLLITGDYFFTQQVTYRDVLDQIAETTFSNIYIKDNKLYLRSFNDGIDTPEVLDNYVIKKGTTNAYFGDVNTFNLGRDPQIGDDAYVSDQAMVDEYGIKELRFVNNQFLAIDRNTYVQDMFPEIKGLGYYPMKVETLGLGYIEFGDWLIVPDKENNVDYKTCVTSYDFTVTSGTKDIITSVAPTTSTEKYKYASAIEKRITNTEIIVDKHEGTIEAISEELIGLNEFLRTVNRRDDFVMLERTPKSTGAINKIKITGFELKELYPDMAYPSNYTFPGVLSFYTLIFSKERVYYSDELPNAMTNVGKVYNVGGLSGKFYKAVDDGHGFHQWVEYNEDIEMVYINSPHPLQLTDEIVIENNEIKVIQKHAYNFMSNQWLELHNPIEYNLGAVAMPTYEPDTYITMKYFKDLTYSVEYIEKNEITDKYQTKVESKGELNISKNQVVLKVDADGHIAETELYADPKTGSRIKLKADDINLEGYTTINDKFKVKLDGSIEAVDGKFSGDIFLETGGKVIGGQGILTNLQYTNDNGLTMIGAYPNFMNGIETVNEMDFLEIDVYVPENFTILEAKIIFVNYPMVFGASSGGNIWGYCRNVKPYIETSGKMAYAGMYYSELHWQDDRTYQEMSGAFGANGVTPSVPSQSTYKKEVFTSNDIKQYIPKGHSSLALRPADPPASTGVFDTDADNCARVTSMGYAVINIIGYMNMEEE